MQNPPHNRLAAVKAAPRTSRANFAIGDVVRHKHFPFRGVVFDIDPVYANGEEWYEAIPQEVRPEKNQPFYHLFAENEQSCYLAYVSQQNLVPDMEQGEVHHPAIGELFERYDGERYTLKPQMRH
jgi:heat shock protein HspQ